MKKLPLFIIIVVALGLFATADYYLNNLDGQVVLDFKNQISDVAAAPVPPPIPTITSLFQLNEKIGNYTVASHVHTSQIFEKFDLSNVNNIKIFRNTLEKESDEAESKPVFLYEIHGPRDQGSLTYLNIKLQFIAQIDVKAETINETSEFGNNSFFFNAENYKDTISFLLVQIGDNLFGLQFDRTDPAVYDDIKTIIQSLTTDSN